MINPPSTFDWRLYLSNFSWGDQCTIQTVGDEQVAVSADCLWFASDYSEAEAAKLTAQNLAESLGKPNFVLVLTGEPSDFDVGRLFYSLKCPLDWTSVNARICQDRIIVSTMDGALDKLWNAIG